MNKTQDDKLKEIIETELETILLTKEAEDQYLIEIHQKMKERSKDMKFSKKKMAVLLTGVLITVLLGAVTVVAAGKITSLVHSSNQEEAVNTVAELIERSKKEMGTPIIIPESFSNGYLFQRGGIDIVNGLDENGNPVESYPDLNARYAGKSKVNLSVHPHLEIIPETPKSPNGYEEVYKDIVLEAGEDHYLFLPPDTEPSEADLKLMDEGKLYISYGSEEEERSVFRTVKWRKDGMDYLLFNFDEVELEELISMAKEIIDKQS